MANPELDNYVPRESAAWSQIRRLINKNAQHRKGFRLQAVSAAFVLSQAEEKLHELRAAPCNPEEMADLFGVLIHYSIKQGWTEDQLERLLLAKLEQRFTYTNQE